MTKRLAAQVSLFPEPPQTISIVAPDPLDARSVRLAILAYVGAEGFLHICETGELDFEAWNEHVRERLHSQDIEATEDELQWMQDHLSYEPTLKSCISAARERLNARLAAEPALPAAATIALFMKGSIKEDMSVFGPNDMTEPTVLIMLTEPLHFECHRGAIFQFHESAVVARMMTHAIPDWTGDPPQEAKFFVLESEEDLSIGHGWVSLKYPSLNKVFPGIFSRLHVSEGKQNTNRSIYYHAAWATKDATGRPEYHSLWSIRDDVRRGTWVCPQLPAANGR
jgi:hypothetical protein